LLCLKKAIKNIEGATDFDFFYNIFHFPGKIKPVKLMNAKMKNIILLLCLQRRVFARPKAIKNGNRSNASRISNASVFPPARITLRPGKKNSYLI
jgi:hypothetical protein